MKISSTVFENNGDIPSRYTCDGENINPPFKIEDIPNNAVSLVLVMDDPDIPDFVKETKKIDVYDHWVVFDIDIDLSDGKGVFDIEEGFDPRGVKGVNSSGTLDYIGPCPPDGKHRYFFKVYALSSLLGLPEGSSKMQLEKAIDGLVVSEAVLMAEYERQQ